MAENKIRETSSGAAFEVILKPASSETVPLPTSPPKERPISQEIIQKKLQDAEERRHNAEQSKLQSVVKDEQRRQEANQKIADRNTTLSEKLHEKQESAEEKKAKQIKAMQERLKEHDKHIQEVQERKQENPESS